MEKITIVKLSSLGDIIHTLPAYNILRGNYPEAEITWVVEKSGEKILRLVKGIDKINTIDTKTLRKGKNIKNNIKKIRAIKKIKSDIVFDFQGTLKSAVITGLISSKIKIGFNKKNLKEKGATFFYNKHGEYFNELSHIIKKNISLLKIIGISPPKQIIFPEFKIREDILSSVDKKTIGINYKDSVILNIGAGWKTKKIDIKKWIELSKRVISRGIFPIILWGTEQEKKDAQIITEALNLKLTPFFKIEELFILFKKVRVVVSSDSFPLHLAEALNTPTIALFGPTPPSRNGPINPDSKIIYHELKCSNCFKKICAKPICMKKITVDDIFNNILSFYKIVNDNLKNI
jgi:heptosyltransferase-1